MTDSVVAKEALNADAWNCLKLITDRDSDGRHGLILSVQRCLGSRAPLAIALEMTAI